MQLILPFPFLNSSRFGATKAWLAIVYDHLSQGRYTPTDVDSLPLVGTLGSSRPSLVVCRIWQSPFLWFWLLLSLWGRKCVLLV